MPSVSGTASAPAPRPASPSLSFSTNRTPTSSYFEDGRTAPPPATAPAQPAQSPTSSTDEAAAAYFFVQQLQRHQQQQQQQRLYASAPSSPGLHPLRPLSRPTTARSRSGSSSSSSARAARSRAGSNASSTTSLHSLSFASQPVPTSSLGSLPPALFPLTPLPPPPSLHHHQQQQQQLQYLPPPLIPPLHDDLPPSYSAAIGAVASDSSSRTAPSRRSTTDETFGVPGSITTSPGPGSGASTPSAHPSRRASLFQYQNQHQQRVTNGSSSHLEGMTALSGTTRSRPASVSDQQQQQQRTPRSSRPSSSYESQPPQQQQQQQQRRSVPMFSLTAMNGPSGRGGAGVCTGNNNTSSSPHHAGHATTSSSSSSYHANSNGGIGTGGRRRLQSRSEVDLPHTQHGHRQGHGHGHGQGYGEQEHHGLRYRQRASTSSASALPTLQDGRSLTPMVMSGVHPRAACVPVRAQAEEQGEGEGALSRVRSRTRPSAGGSARRVRAPPAHSTDPAPPRPARTLLRTLLKPTQSLPRLLLHLLLLPIWALTSVPHSHQAVVDAQPWGARVLLFPLRLFAAVPGCVGTFWLVRNVGVRLGCEGVGSLGRGWEGGGGGGVGREGEGKEQLGHPTAVVFAIASLWSLSTAYYALSLTTLLLRRWLLYYSLPSSIIRLVALQAICWPLVRITLFVFGSQRPLEAWILIASTTAVSDVVARWLVSNIVDRVEGLGAWVGEEGEGEGVGLGPGREVGNGGKRSGTRRRRRRRQEVGRAAQVGDGAEDIGDGTLPTGADGIEAELCDLTPTMDDGIKDDTTSTSSDDASASGSASGSGSDSSAWGANFRHRHRHRRRRGTRGEEGEEQGEEGWPPRRTASFPRLPTSDVLRLDEGERRTSVCGPTGAGAGGGSATRPPRSLGSGRRSDSASASASGSFSSLFSSSSISSSRSGSGSVSEAEEEEEDEEEFLRLLSDDLPVRRVFHWDVAIKRNILPMGVLAYASLWVLLASSKVEGRGR